MISSSTRLNVKFQFFLLLTLLFVFITPAQADTENDAAAQVLFSHGNVVLTNAASSYSLEKGGFVSAGDTVITGDDGRVQLRFTDGGLVSLMPNSRFAVEEYSQPTEDAEGSVSVNLIKGGLRALSGSIGKKDHDNYKLKTDVATLGIRGTQFVVVMDGAAMRVHVGQGRVALFNTFGQLLVPTGRYAEVFPGKAPSLSKVPAVFVSSTQPNSQSEEEQSEEEQGEGNQSQEKQNEGNQSQDKQSEANQDPAAASTATEVARTLEPGVSQGEEAGKIRIEDEDGNTQTHDIPKNTNKPDNQTPPVDTNPIDPNPAVPDPGVPDPGVPDPVVTNLVSPNEYPDVKGFVELKSSLNLNEPGPGIASRIVGQNEGPIPTTDSDMFRTGDLYWREGSSVSANNPNETIYTATIWGPSSSNLPATGTLNYSLADASIVRSNKDDKVLTEFKLQIKLTGAQWTTSLKADLEFSDGLKIGHNALEDASFNADTGRFNINHNYKHNTPLVLMYSRDNGEAEVCTDCIFGLQGFLSGEQGKQAGVAYRLEIGPEQDDYSGTAILNKVP